MAISYPSLRGSQDPWQSSVVLCIFTKVDPHVATLLGMTLIYYSNGIRSRQLGFNSPINITLRCLDQLLICFSRVIADIIVGCSSINTTTCKLKRRVNCEPTPFRCSSTLFLMSAVTPVYKTVLFALVSMYTHGFITLFIFPLSKVDPHVALLLGMTLVYPVIARVA